MSLKRFYFATLLVMGLTIFHHFYGSLIYEDPFRKHVVFIAVPVMLIQWISYRFYTKSKGGTRGIGYLFFMIISWVGPILSIGIFEGGYNHVLKDILFFSGASMELLTSLFPPPKYEMPNDWIFEVTGILQFVVAVFAIIYAFRHYRSSKT